MTTSIMMATLPFSNNKNSINHNSKKSNKNNSNHNSNNKNNNRNSTSVSVQGKSSITNVTNSFDHVAGYSFFDSSTIGSNNSSTSSKLSSGLTGPIILQKKRPAPSILNNSCRKQHKSVDNNSIQSNGANIDNERNEMILNQLSMLLHPIIDAKPTAAASGSSLTTMIPNGYNSYNHDSVKYHKSNTNSLLDDTTITNTKVLQLIEQHFKQQQVESAVIQLLQKQQQQESTAAASAASAAAVYQQQQKQQQQHQHQQLREQVQRQLNDTMNLNNPINSASTPVPASATATAVMIQRLAMILQDSSSLTNCTTSNANPYNFSPSSFACKPLAQLPSPPPSPIGSLTKQQEEQQLLSFLQRCCNNTNDFVLVDDTVRNSTAGNTSVSTLMQLLQLLLACKAQQQKDSTSCIPTQRQTTQHNQSQMMTTTTTSTPSSRATTSNDNEQSIAAAILQTLLMANIEPAAASFVAEAATVAVPAQQQQQQQQPQNATIKDILLLRALLGQRQASGVGDSNPVEMKPKPTTSSGERNNDGMIPYNTKQSSSLSSSQSQLEHFQLQQQLWGYQQQAATTAKLPHTLLSLCGALHDTVGRLNKLHNNSNSNQDSTISEVSSSSVSSSGCGTMTTDTAHGATTTAQRSTTVPTPLSSLMSLFQQTAPTTAMSTNSSSSYYNDGATNLSVGQHQEHHPSMFTPLSSISSSSSSSASSLYFSITKEQLKELTVGSELVCPGVCGDVPDSLFLAMAQMKLCTLTSEDLVGKCKKRRIGEIGLCCKHCNGTPGSGRYFPSTIDSFLNGTNGEKIVEHAGFVCKCCPSAIAQIISRLYKYEQSQIVRKPYGTRKHFYMYAWTKMTAIRTAPTVSSVAATMTKPVVHCCSSNPDTTSSSAS